MPKPALAVCIAVNTLTKHALLNNYIIAVLGTA